MVIQKRTRQEIRQSVGYNLGAMETGTAYDAGSQTTLISLTLVVLLSACSPGWEAANKNSSHDLGGTAYEWVGCHVVTENPKNGAYAIGPLVDLKRGTYFYFKQVGSDGKVKEVVTGKPC